MAWVTTARDADAPPRVVRPARRRAARLRRRRGAGAGRLAVVGREDELARLVARDAPGDHGAAAPVRHAWTCLHVLAWDLHKPVGLFLELRAFEVGLELQAGEALRVVRLGLGERSRGRRRA